MKLQERLRELLAKATAGPWELLAKATAFSEKETAIEATVPNANGGKVIALCYGPERDQNAALIAELIALTPDLLTRLDRYEAALREARKCLVLANHQLGVRRSDGDILNFIDAALSTDG
jgi:hypothetical protein